MALDYHAISAAAGRGTPLATTDIVSNTNRRDVSEILDLLALSETPFINRIGWGSDSGGTAIEWISENLGTGVVAVTSGASSASTAFSINTIGGMTTAEAGKQLQTGSVFSHYDSGNGELQIGIVATNDGAGEITFETVAGTTTSMTAGDLIYVLGAAANEGSLPRTPMERDRGVQTNNFSILRQDVAITGSEAATDFYAISKEDKHQMLMRLKELQRERERMALYSMTVTRTTTAASIMDGVYGFLYDQGGDNIDTSTTALTESAVNTVVSECWDNGSENLTFFGGIDQTAKFTQWDKNRIRMGPRENKGGGYISYYMTECGVELEIVPMRKVPTNIAFVLDTSKIKLRAKKGRKAIIEKLGKMGDAEDWQIISEFSLEMKGYNLSQHGLFTKLT